jgi:hypothetical protein
MVAEGKCCKEIDALRASLKSIRERIGHALTGSFTLDVCGGQSEWERNLEDAQMIGAEHRERRNEAGKRIQTCSYGRLISIQRKGLGALERAKSLKIR